MKKTSNAVSAGARARCDCDRLWGLRRLLAIALFCLLGVGAASALDPTQHITQYAHDSWETRDGLPQNTVQVILQTHDGYLWLGTQEGLVRFDGVRFTTFDSRNTPAMKGNFIWALAEDPEGSLWIGTSGGLLQHHGTTFTNLTTQDGLANNVVRALTVDPSGRLWIGTGGGGVQWREHGKFVTPPSDQAFAGATIRDVMIARGGDVWVRTLNHGVARIHGGKTQLFGAASGLSSDTTSAMCQSHDGRIWVGTHNGLDVWDPERPDRFAPVPALATHFVEAVYQDLAGNVWVGTDGGLFRINNSGLEAYAFNRDLGSPAVASIYEDREGNLWVGMLVGGLFRFKDGGFTTYSTQEGLANDFTRAIVEDHAGRVWIGTGGGGVDEFDGRSFRHHSTQNGLSSNLVFALLEDRDHSLWVGTGDGLDQLKDGRVRIFRTQNGLANNYVRSLAQTSDGAVWIGTDAGLSRWANGAFRTYSTQDGLSNETVIALYPDRSGNLWVGTRHGVNLIRNGAVVDFPQRASFSEDIVEAFYEDQAGTLWIGTSTDGLKRLSHGSVTTFGPKQGLFESTLHAIVADREDYLWITSNKGVYRVQRRQLDDFAAGKSTRVDTLLLGQQDGMRSSECDTGAPAAWVTRDGRLWFPTVKGVAVLNPDSLRTTTTQPPVIVERVGLDDDLIEQLGARLEVPAQVRRLEFHYVALSYASPLRVHFKYQLQGFDRDWVDAGTRRVAYYTNLPPGDYTFLVTASTSDERWPPVGASLAVTVRPHFYQAYWFYALCALALTLVLWAAIWWYEERLRSRERELRVVQQALEEKNAAEITLRESEERFSVAFRQSPDPIVLGQVEDKYLRIVDVNDSMVEFWGGPREDLIGRSGKDLGLLVGRPGVPAQDWNESVDRVRFWKIIRETGRIRNFPAYLRRKSGEVRSALLSADMYQMRGQRWMLVTGRDVTHENAVRDALLASEARYRDLFENANDFIFTASPRGGFLSINKAGQTLCGVSAEAALHKSVSEVLDEASAAVYEHNTAELLATLQPATFEVTLRHGVAGGPLLELGLRPIVESGVVLAVQGIGRNVTERRMLEKKFLQSQKMQAVGTLAGGIAHDFNNLLTVITGYTHMAREKAGNRSAIAGDLEEIQQATRRAASLTSQLLAFSRKQVAQKSAIDLNESVNGMQRLLKRLIGEDIKLETRFDPRLLPIWADPTQIDQVIMNLAANARDAMPNGGTLRFATSNLRLKAPDPRRNLDAGDYAVLTVADTGVGMDQATASRVFEPFFTTKDVGKGTGLGLSTAYGIVQQAGGQISVVSEPDRGATFTIYFPAAESEAGDRAAPPVKESFLGTETLLLVEDDPALRALALKVLESAGYTVYAAAGVAEAERVLQEISAPIDLIITDVVMPDGGGQELVARVARSRPRTKVLFMSGYTDGKVPEEYFTEGHPSFLAKPFEPMQLARKVRQVLDSQQAFSTAPLA